MGCSVCLDSPQRAVFVQAHRQSTALRQPLVGLPCLTQRSLKAFAWWLLFQRLRRLPVASCEEAALRLPSRRLLSASGCSVDCVRIRVCPDELVGLAATFLAGVFSVALGIP